MAENEQQRVFFGHIRSLISPGLSFADEIADVLGISSDSAYRRIRGEKPISFDEISILCKRYGVSLDQVLHIHSDSTIFHGRNLNTAQFDFEHYLGEILQRLQEINKATHKKLYYEAKDIPIFHHFQFPELATFKFFFWMRSVMYYPEYGKMYFEDNELTTLFQQKGMEIIRTYTQIPSVEIWVAESIHATIRQVEYYSDSGIFRKKESIALLYQQLEQLIDHIGEQAEHGEKFMIGTSPNGKGGTYEVYYNEVFLGHNSIIVETDGITTAFLNHAVMNFMYTRDEAFCQYTRRSIENNIKKSLLISSVGEKERLKFLNLLRATIHESKRRTLG